MKDTIVDEIPEAWFDFQKDNFLKILEPIETSATECMESLKVSNSRTVIFYDGSQEHERVRTLIGDDTYTDNYYLYRGETYAYITGRIKYNTMLCGWYKLSLLVKRNPNGTTNERTKY